MTCSDVKDLLSPYLDGELDRVTQQAVFRHLSECFNCHNELAEMQQLVKMLACLEEIVPPEDFSAKLSCRLLERAAAKPKMRKRYGLTPQSWLPLGAAAAIIMALAFSLNLWPGEQKAADAPGTAVSPQLVPVEKMPATLSVDKGGGASLKSTAEGAGFADQQAQIQAQIKEAPAPVTPAEALGIQTVQENSAFQARSLPAPEEVCPSGKLASRNGKSAGEAITGEYSLDSPLVEKWTISLSDIEEGYRRITSFSENINWNVVTLAESPREIVLCMEGQMEGLDSLLSFIKDLGELEHRENFLPQLLFEQNNVIRQVNEEFNLLLKAKSEADDLSEAEIEAHIGQNRYELALLTKKAQSLQMRTAVVRVEAHIFSK
ncbi:MAG: anti-sigma factor family protein [Bacillota bacterium]